MNEIAEFIVTKDTTIKNALAKLNQTGQGVLILINEEGKLLRTVTDGDIRRLLLNNCSMESDLYNLDDKMPKYITDPVTPSSALAVMNKYSVDHLPVVTEAMVPIRLLLRRNITSSILLSTPHLGEYEKKYVAEAFKTNWIAPLGPNVDAFEQELAAHVGIRHAAALSSGTAALHLALRILDVKANDIVFCSSFTFAASANPILYQQATPVFIDSEPESWNMSVQALERALHEHAQEKHLPKAVIVVNLYGQSANFDPILELCNHYNVPVIEDAAESLGAKYKNQASGTLGKIGIYSFNGNKIITTSGGGMLVSNDEEIVNRARFLSTQARDCAPYYQHTELGYNYRMSNVLAGIGRGQLQVLNERVAARRKVFHNYEQQLANIPAIEWMPEAYFGFSTRWLSAMTLNPKYSPVNATQLISELAKHNIEARHTWKPMQQQPLYASYRYYPYEKNKSISDEIFEHGVCLPSGSNLAIDDQQRVIDAIKNVLVRN